MTVKEFALRQLHWMVQSDPWVQEIFLAGGESLDQLAERILAVSRFDNFALLNRAQVEYYEKILGLPQVVSMALRQKPCFSKRVYP